MLPLSPLCPSPAEAALEEPRAGTACSGQPAHTVSGPARSCVFLCCRAASPKETINSQALLETNTSEARGTLILPVPFPQAGQLSTDGN